MTKKFVLYTGLFGNYEELNELSLSQEFNVDRIVFTDSESLQSDTWQIHKVSPEYPGDSVRSQRMIKLRRPELIKRVYEGSLYIDNTVSLKAPVSEILELWLEGVDVAIPQHSFRENLRDEFLEVAAAKLDSGERIEEQLETYKKHFPEILDEPIYWAGMIARRSSDELDKFEDIWLNQVLRYSRRDQLSLNLAIKKSSVTHSRILIDNLVSNFHEWPILNNRLQHIRSAPNPDYKSIFEATTTQLEESEINASVFRSNIQQLSREINALNDSYSFKLTKPLRVLHSYVH
jgi:hypothetical protein